eukprot:TRINITY_DN5324_c0_g1_i1.p1 TRINITY_DN5324_c0_g1~~TRINITY_DN5324_c0_g1_i1.p1  ORF type:complete len:306 (-),score=61.63 TRINITY_DN5324_c0_g1_i1:727-1644(-)
METDTARNIGIHSKENSAFRKVLPKQEDLDAQVPTSRPTSGAHTPTTPTKRLHDSSPTESRKRNRHSSSNSGSETAAEILPTDPACEVLLCQIKEHAFHANIGECVKLLKQVQEKSSYLAHQGAFKTLQSRLDQAELAMTKGTPLDELMKKYTHTILNLCDQLRGDDGLVSMLAAAMLSHEKTDASIELFPERHAPAGTIARAVIDIMAAHLDQEHAKRHIRELILNLKRNPQLCQDVLSGKRGPEWLANADVLDLAPETLRRERAQMERKNEAAITIQDSGAEFNKKFVDGTWMPVEEAKVNKE